ncbi:MAG: hypothetical protein RIE53_12150 [Rhodothermales bacterium]
MDLDIIFWIAIAAIYLLQGFIGRKKPQQGPAGQSPDGVDPSVESSPDMDSALEEIRSILTGEPLRRPEPQPQSDPAAQATRRPAPTRVQEVELPPAHWETFGDMEFGQTSTPKSESRAKDPFKAQPKPKAKPKPELVLEPLPQERDATLHPATDIAAMRKAVVLSEILRPPVSKRRY